MQLVQAAVRILDLDVAGLAMPLLKRQPPVFPGVV